MFTGIVEEIGTIAEVRDQGNGRRIRVSARTVLQDLAPGDSVAVDGVCLTATEVSPEGFSVDAIATTLGRTTIGALASGSRVNLERAAALGDRLGGHLVQGHVDGSGSVIGISPQAELVLVDVEIPDAVAEVTVLHGSITINGISLTVNDLPRRDVVQVSIIPFTWEHTTMQDLRVGDGVNLEGDLIGKYVRQLLHQPARPGRPDLRRAWGYE